MFYLLGSWSIVPILLIVLIVFLLRLSSRVKRLEEITKLNNIPASQPIQSGASVPVANPVLGASGQVMSQVNIGTVPAVPPIDKPTTPVVPNTPMAPNRFSEWLKEEWLLKLGSLLLLIGFGWLTTYAFLNNWIGPTGRIMLGILAGTIFIILGWWRIRKFIHQGGVFLVLGSTTILLAVFAARAAYQFFTPISAMGIMFLSTLFVAIASVKYNNRTLALASLILAGSAPLLTGAPANYIELFSYLFVVTLGAISISVITGRRELTTAALVMVALYSLPHLFSFVSSDKGTLILFAYAFTTLFFITNTAGILKAKGGQISADLVTAAGNGLFLLAWIVFAAQEELKSLLMSGWAVAFIIGAFLIFKITQRREPFYAYAGVAIAMLATATAAELSGPALVIAYTIECGVVILISHLLLKNIKIVSRMSLLLIGPVILSLQSMASGAWRSGVIHDDFFVLFILGFMLLALGSFFLFRDEEGPEQSVKNVGKTMLFGASVYIYILLWLSLHAAEILDNDLATMISLLVYTLVGIITYFHGLRSDKKDLKVYGGILLGFVVARLLLVDVWAMEIAGRIITFFIIGVLLISTAFISRRKKSVQQNVAGDQIKP